MRIAVCDASADSRDRLCRWIAQYCGLYGIGAEIVDYAGQREFFEAYGFGHADVVFMGLDGPDGFLAARRLRETDPNCRIVYVDANREYAARGVRLRFSDYIVRPVEFKDVVRAMKLCGAGGTGG